MGSYVGIGFRSLKDDNDENLSIVLNRGASNALEMLIDESLQNSHPKLYKIITEVLVLDQFNFYELSKNDFNTVVKTITDYISAWKNPSELQLYQKKLWEETLLPLIQQDERYQPS